MLYFFHYEISIEYTLYEYRRAYAFMQKDIPTFRTRYVFNLPGAHALFNLTLLAISTFELKNSVEQMCIFFRQNKL